ncbi:MAG: hypothetical protein MI725_01685 [Pirellulales bacterium]|nr:hypothetical protein [Pirellulales bacterium]
MKADDFTEALEKISVVTTETTSQSEIQQAWKLVAGEAASRLPTVLSAMHKASPLAENWLRAACDTIAERELRATGRLPAQQLQRFVLDVHQSPRARRTAYEWLNRVDETVPQRLLPKLLDDPSLEIRYDAIAQALSEAGDETSEETKVQNYQRLLSFARHKDQISACVAALQELGQAPDLSKHFGYITAWNLIGPFDNTEGAGFDAVYPPEQEVDFSRQYAGKEGQVAWKEFRCEQTEVDKLGLIDLNQALVEQKEVVAYAAATFLSNKDQQVECRYTSVNATKLFINGELVASQPVYHSGSSFDQYIVPVKLHAGANQILLKIAQNAQTQPWARGWEFQLRISDNLGGAIPHAW